MEGDGDGDGNKESPEVNEGEEGEKKNPSSRMKERNDEDSLVYWESLQDQRSLHVLLVENDASVRLAITLLLRKCGYQRKTGVVFNCLSEGAADYLLKPVRKNELKNLWQHIWRIWHCSCGSEREDSAQAENPMKLKGVDNFDDDNTGSNNEDDSASFGLIVEGGSDNFSDTQGSF